MQASQGVGRDLYLRFSYAKFSKNYPIGEFSQPFRLKNYPFLHKKPQFSPFYFIFCRSAIRKLLPAMSTKPSSPAISRALLTATLTSCSTYPVRPLSAALAASSDAGNPRWLDGPLNHSVMSSFTSSIRSKIWPRSLSATNPMTRCRGRCSIFLSSFIMSSHPP